jgi:Uma2 family endonuclease
MSVTLAKPKFPTPATYGRDDSIPRISLEQYRKMIDSGALTSADPVELLEQFMVLKMPRNPRHDSTLQKLQRPLIAAIPAGWDYRNQSSITLPDDSQPEPDFAIIRGSYRDYIDRHPTPEEIGLLVEVADSSLLRDQYDKSRIYSRAGIAEYWIVNLQDRRIEVSGDPSGPCEAPSYGTTRFYAIGETIPLRLDGVEVAVLAVADLLP